MRKVIVVAAIGFLLAAHAPSGQTTKASYIEFDVPGAGTTPGGGTFPTVVNEDGTVGGHYLASGRYYAFMRATTGTITKIHISGAEYTDASTRGGYLWNLY